MNEGIEQGLHEKLCAYVLGESEGADRAEVERELLRSPELRAERERLENTIGAVRDALAPAEVLTAEAKAALERAVSESTQRPSRIAQFPWMRLAAGIGAVGLGWWIFAGAPGGRSDVMVARGESEALYDADHARSARLKKDARSDELASGIEQRGVSKLQGDLEAKRPARDQTASLGRLEGLGYAGDSTPVAKSAPSEVLPVQANTPTPTARSLEVVSGNTATTSVGQAAASEGPSSGGYVGSKTGGGQRMGRASGSAPSPSAAALPPASPGWSYLVPGESTPPSPGLAAGESGSSTGPSSPGPARSNDLLFVNDRGAESKGEERFEKDKENLARLSLGYSGDDGDDFRQPDQKKSWRHLSPEEQARQIEIRHGTIVQGCFPRPNERPRDMFFRFWGDNPFEVTQLDRLSTFSVDVDTASYALARRYLNEGKVPEKAQIRTEEFLNYFASDVEAPRNATFSVHSDLTPSRFSADSARQMLRVVVRAKDVDKFERQPMHLTFVVDVSGSMREQNRLETVKNALRMLVAQLDGRDSIALVTFSNDAKLILPMTQVLDRAAIEAAIAPLKYGGSTNSNAGLQLGYAQALTGLDPNVVNRVVFLSDGVANVGETDAAKILEGVKSIREQGIYLNTIGVGMNNHNDVLLEQLADKGDGMCNYVDSPKEIQRALVDRFTGAFQPIAKDVKIQVEFDPQQVMRYRLLGYENRAIADADFRNDAVDAGEIGAGHQVTALYEIEPTGRGGDGPMATVRLRWKPIRAAGATGEQEATEASFDVSAKSYQAFESAPPGYRRAAIVAQFAEILRHSIHARGESLDDLIAEATKLQAQIPSDADFAEFTAMLVRAKDLILRSLPACDDLCQTVDALRSNVYLGAVFHETGRDPRALEEIEQNRRELEQRLREVLRRQAEAEAGIEPPRVK